MPRLTFHGIVQKDLSAVVSPNDLKRRYLAGLPLPDSITDETLGFFIESATSELENYLSLKFNKTIIQEDKDFDRESWIQWNYIKASYPVVCPISILGWLGKTKQAEYPKTWLSAKKTNDGKFYSRALYMIPSRAAQHSEIVTYTGVYPQANYFGNQNIPHYWSIKYTTGWNKVPSEIVDAIGMIASFKVLQIISDALMIGALTRTVNNLGQQVLSSNGTGFGGLGFGVASKSISIDGLSQSTSSYVNGTTGVWGARLKQYGDMLNPNVTGSLMNRLYDQYAAIVMGVA